MSQHELTARLNVAVQKHLSFSYETIKKPITISEEALARKIDHTLLKPDATLAQYETLCKEAMAYGFYSVCVPSSIVGFAKGVLGESEVKVVSTAGFPHGTCAAEAKAFEARQALEKGATEIDMVIHLGYLKSKCYFEVYADIFAVVDACAPHPVKVILETGLLTKEEKIIAAALSTAAGAAFLKTSTGVLGAGASETDVALLKEVSGDGMQVKASGGIRTLAVALNMLAAGADRLGTSSGVDILKKHDGGKHETIGETHY